MKGNGMPASAQAVRGRLAVAATAVLLAAFPVRAGAAPDNSGDSLNDHTPAPLSDSALACLSCHQSEGMTVTFADGTEAEVFVDPRAYAGSVHAREGFDCDACHTEVADYPHPEVRASASEWRLEQQQVCAWCHSEGEDFDLGAHGRALTRGDTDVPNCTTCHGDPHRPPPATAQALRAEMVRVCASCHGDDELMVKHGVKTGTVSTYLSEFHGLTARLLLREGAKSVPVAVCVDCHGAHRILPASDPASTVHVLNLPNTCRKCHPGATEAFATAWSMHRDPESHPLVGGIAWFYRILIGLAVVGFFGYIGLELAHHRGRRRNRRWPPDPGGPSASAGGPSPNPARPSPDPGGLSAGPAGGRGEGQARRWVQRFTPWQVIEHAVLTVTFAGLALTGIPQKYADLAISRWTIEALGGIERVRDAHHALGFALIALGVVHLIGLAGRGLRYGFRTEMWPSRQDVRDLLKMLRYFLGVDANPAAFGRFSFKEKFEYWAVVWGTAVMGLTGLALLYPQVATRFFPGVVVPASRAMHGGEAVLAVVAILIWHMYNAHLRPGVFPLDRTIFTGRMPFERWVEEHPLEWERMRISRPGPSGPGGDRTSPDARPEGGRAHPSLRLTSRGEGG